MRASILTPFRSLNHSGIRLRDAIAGILYLLTLIYLPTLTGCAITDEQRFPLEDLAVPHAAYQIETARAALPAYQRMGADFERRGQFAPASVAYSDAAASASALGRLQDALDISQKAVEMAERSGSPRHLGRALFDLGYAYLQLGALEKAIPILEQGVETSHRAGVGNIEASCHSGLSQVYRRLGNPAKALEHAEKAVEIMGNFFQINATEWSRLGSRGRSWISTAERGYGNQLKGLGWAHAALREWAPAQAAFQKALEIGERNRVAFLIGEAHGGLGTVAARQRDFQTAVTHLEEAMRVNPRPGFVAATQGTLGRIYRETGQLPEAEDALRKAVAGIEDLRSFLQSEELRESFFEDKVGIYEDLILTLLARGKGPEAFDVSERARARAFLDLLGNRVTLSRGRSQALLAEEQALRERISALKALPEDAPALRQELELAREAYQAFLQRVRQMDREQASLMTVEPLTLPQVQALLPEGTVLLEYFVTDQGQTLLWTVERDRVEVATLPLGRDQVSARVQAFRDLIAARDRQPEMERLAQTLFDEFVRPGLPGRLPKELLIVPHDALHYLPFQALMPAPGRYLLQEVPLHYYSSASLMQFTRAKEQAGAPTFFALGNPDFQDETLSLHYAAREARGIAALFPDTALLTGKAATKATSLDEIRRYSVLHFATHAEFDEADPLGSSLLLAATGGEEGRLEVQEIFGLDLHASLVVLSACETALGKLSRGDELTGLTRAFIYAGTPSVITTLWQVNDRAAFELMQEFYRQLKAGADKAAALRQAQLAMLARRPRPYYWAAYELIGEAR